MLAPRKGFSFSITLANAFMLIAMIQTEMEADTDFMQRFEMIQKPPLHITSHDLKSYFCYRNIVPWEKYSSFYADQPAEVAVTYEWTTKLYQLERFLSNDNIKTTNMWLPFDISFWERLYLMFFGWIFMGPLNLIPPDMKTRCCSDSFV